jgi:GT2 family glycosyltransferase
LDVSIIIVNYNTREITSQCIESIYEQTDNITFEVILIDNNSTDGSVEFFSNDKRIKLIQNRENSGFGHANNIGIKKASGKYIFCLNSDTFLLNNAIKMLYDFAESYGKNAVFGTWLLDNQEKIIHSYGKFPSIKTELYNALRVYGQRIPYLSKYCIEYTEIFSEEPKLVDYIIGADMFIPRYVIEISGMFDERYFMYCEDTDWQKRMVEKGIERILINGPKIVHSESKSSSKEGGKSMKKNLLSTKAMFLYMKKHYHNTNYLFFRTLYALLRLFPTLSNEYTCKEKSEYLKLLFAII